MMTIEKQNKFEDQLDSLLGKECEVAARSIVPGGKTVYTGKLDVEANDHRPGGLEWFVYDESDEDALGFIVLDIEDISGNTILIQD